MKLKIFPVIFLNILLIAGCSRDTITITPETLTVEAEASTAVVKTSGFVECEIIFRTNDENHSDVTLNKGYADKYDAEWFNVVVSDDWRELYFQFDENISPEQRSAIFQLSAGDIFNRFTVIQQGVDLEPEAH